MQRGAAVSAFTGGRGAREWPGVAGGGSPLKASAESPDGDEARAGSENARPLVAEVDHFHSLRAR